MPFFARHPLFWAYPGFTWATSVSPGLILGVSQTSPEILAALNSHFPPAAPPSRSPNASRTPVPSSELQKAQRAQQPPYHRGRFTNSVNQPRSLDPPRSLDHQIRQSASSPNLDPQISPQPNSPKSVSQPRSPSLPASVPESVSRPRSPNPSFSLNPWIRLAASMPESIIQPLSPNPSPSLDPQIRLSALILKSDTQPTSPDPLLSRSVSQPRSPYPSPNVDPRIHQPTQIPHASISPSLNPQIRHSA